MRPRAVCLLCCSVLATLGCTAVSVKGQRLRNRARGYSVDLPGPAWQAETAEAGLFVARNRRISGTLFVLTSGEKTQRGTLPLLSRVLFLGLKDVVVHKRRADEVAGCDAVYSEITAKTDGIAVRIAAFCFEDPAGAYVYDVGYFAPPKEFGQGEVDFRRLVDSFKFDRGATAPKKK